jgi:diguanylate cyclase (GGDEF)-like protein/PAS domain S-box-containing protein
MIGGSRLNVRSWLPIARRMTDFGCHDRACAYRPLLEQTPAVTYLADFDEDYVLRYMSPQVEALLGFPVEDWLASPEFWVERLHPDDRDRVCAEAEAAIAEVRPLDVEYRMLARDGRVVWMWERTAIQRSADGTPNAVQGVMVEITPLKEAEAREAGILEAALDAILTIDGDGTVVEFNPAAERIFGCRRAHAIGRDMAELIIPKKLRDAHRAGVAALMAGDGGNVIGRRVNLTAQRLDGTEFPAEITITRLETGGRALFTGFVRDISDRVSAEETLRHLAYHDALTGLANRAQLEDHLAKALARAESAGTAVALLYVDIDGFKLVNDSFGHAVGDEVLQAVAGRMERALRGTDVIARHGGDEFLVLLSDLDSEPRAVAETVALKLVATLRQPFAISGLEFQIDATVGISLFPDDADSADALLRHADAAMYAGKGTGPVAVYAQGRTDPRGRLSLTRRLRHALAQGELELHYQPIVMLADGAPVGAEALLRWRDPERGLVPPMEFLPVAEESGLIEPIGEWVVGALCRQARAWLDEGIEPELAFNVSLHQLRPQRFASALESCLRGYRLDPGRFTAEITESATMREPELVESALGELHELGVRLAIDDFGAGYSSLGRLQQMPVDTLKIDRSFLLRLAEGDSAAAVVGTIVQLAAALGMAAVAEGVETEAQRAVLLERGCERAQGYLFGRPMPAPELTALFAARPLPGGLPRSRPAAPPSRTAS